MPVAKTVEDAMKGLDDGINVDGLAAVAKFALKRALEEMAGPFRGVEEFKTTSAACIDLLRFLRDLECEVRGPVYYGGPGVLGLSARRKDDPANDPELDILMADTSSVKCLGANPLSEIPDDELSAMQREIGEELAKRFGKNPPSDN